MTKTLDNFGPNRNIGKVENKFSKETDQDLDEIFAFKNMVSECKTVNMKANSILKPQKVRGSEVTKGDFMKWAMKEFQ